MRKILGFICLLTLCLNAGIITQTNTKKARGEGYGATYEEAVSKALADAVGKMNGVKLHASTLFVTNSTQNGKKRNMQKVYEDVIHKKTRGKFDSYDVISKIKTSTGYKVKVAIKKIHTKKYYKTPGFSPNNRRRIAVIPIYANDMMFNILGERFFQTKVTQHLTQEVVSAITQTRKFTILDREAKQAYNSEKKLILTDGAKDELVKIGSVLGTDYLYVLNVSDFSIDKNTQKDNYTGVVSDDVMVNATIEYRIIVMATRQIKYSNTKNFSFKAVGNNNNQYFLNALQTISKGLTDDIMNNIYPVKIAQVSGNEVILSQKLKAGDKYEVFSLGKKIYDSYTKEAVGYDEKKIGLIQITRVNPKMSYAKIIEGSAKKGNLCRLITQAGEQGETLNRPDVTEEEKPSDVVTTQGGGVILPID